MEKILRLSSLTATVLTLAVLVALSGIALANPGADLSHIEVRAAADSLSHINAHRPGLPPPALLVPLGNGVEGVLKGHAVADEARIMDAITRRRLNQMVLRVASATVGDRRMALVKLQAGRRSGEFVIEDLRQDAAACLHGVFNSGLKFDHLDLWSVVPGPGMVGDQQEHHPVFSLSISRSDYIAATHRGSRALQDGPELLDRLPGVRYSPVFTRHALPREATDLPKNAFSDPPLTERWDDLLTEAPRRKATAPRAANASVEAIFSGSNESDLVALTIDDGPSPLITPLMLEILEREGVQATFFVVGQVVEHFPALAKLIARGGHELANHSYSHRRINHLSDEETWAEITACDRVVREATGKEMRWFRPPGGRASAGGLRAMASLGYAAAFWSQNAGDWVQPPPEQIVRNATEGLEPGGIILMHQVDMCSVEALPEIISRVREMGLEPTTLSRVAAEGGIVRDDPAAMSDLVNRQISPEY